ncbi:MAG: RtcB family protein [Lachnospiraceae bacterium]|nr:RtcB family protein [Lachnospiraceae bacterium]
MFEIKGKRNTAICYATVVEEKAIEQIRRMCDYEVTDESKIRIMPDVHAGKGCTIGTTMTITDKVIPNVVGVDIGCGMYTTNLGNVDIDFEKLDEATHFIRSGMSVWDSPIEKFDFTKLRCFEELKSLSWLENSLGTLGGGNHFIEVDSSNDGTKYLIIHSGSRNLGKQVAEIYQGKAIDQHKGIDDYRKNREQLIISLKEKGEFEKIQHALDELKKKKYIDRPDMPEDLCFLSKEPFNDYLHDVEICQEFARRNRGLITEIILEKTGLKSKGSFHTIHNYIDTNEMILRKGAIAAHKGEKVLIPINMRDGSILAKGKGNPEWNYSAPHGAGRIMSRKEALRKLTMEEYHESMKGIYTTSVCSGTLDEAPMAYKSIEDIIGVITDTVDIIEVLKPVYNFKAKEEFCL